MRIMITSLLLLVANQAVSGSSLPTQLGECAKIANHLERLTCYDQLAATAGNQAKVPSQPSLPAQAQAQPVAPVESVSPAPAKSQSAPVVAKTMTTPVQTTPSTNDFGFENKVVVETPDKINVSILEKERNANGHWRLVLANGQVWKQSTGGRYKIYDSRQSFIKKGALGSFFFGQEGLNRQMRVKRIK